MKLIHLFSIILPLSVLLITACSPAVKETGKSGAAQDEPMIIKSNVEGKGTPIEIIFEKGRAHNHPTFAIWLEDTTGRYLQSLFVTRSIGQGVFTYGDKSGGKWKPGEVRRPAALPVWSHQRGIKAADGLYVPDSGTKVPDAYSGATPKGSFVLETRTDSRSLGKVKLMFEINQTWDWNEYWTNNKFPDDNNYKTSSQPSLVYSALIDLDNPGTEYELQPIGHGHYSGADGLVNPDISTLTTALKIANTIKVKVAESR